MPKYQNGKIYKLTSPHTDKIYIGSTTIELGVRLNIHKSQAKKLISCSSKYLFELGEDDVKIELIKNYAVDKKEQLTEEERRIMEETTNVVNQRRACVTLEELTNERRKYQRSYCDRNRTKVNKEKLEYYYKNKEKCQIRFKKYYEKKRIKKMKEFEKRMDEFMDMLNKNEIYEIKRYDDELSINKDIIIQT